MSNSSHLLFAELGDRLQAFTVTGNASATEKVPLALRSYCVVQANL